MRGWPSSRGPGTGSTSTSPPPSASTSRCSCGRRFMQADARPAETTVLIVGGGPSGLTLALDLGLRGIDCHVINAELERAQNPRCNTTSARSMEHFRRLGVAGSVRAAGLPADYPTTVQYRTSMTGYELFRMDFPSSRDVMDGVGKEGWATPEPQHRISQIYLEPVLEEKDRATEGDKL